MSSETDLVIDIVINIIGDREVEDEAENSSNKTKYSETGSYLGGFVFWQNPVIGSVVGKALGSFVDLYFAKGTSIYVRDILDKMSEKSRKSLAKKIKSIIDDLGFKTVSEFHSFYKKNWRNKENYYLRKFSEKSVALIKIEAERYQNNETSIRKSTKEDRNHREKYGVVTDESKTKLTRKNKTIPNKKDKPKRRVKVSSSSESNEESSEKSLTDESEESDRKVERSTKTSSTSEKEKKQKYKLKSRRNVSPDRNKKERKSKHSKRSSSLEKSKKKDKEKSESESYLKLEL